MALSRQRDFVTPLPGEDWPKLAARVLPDEDPGAAVQRLRSWNLHLFVRVPPGQFTGSDVIFVEPPREGDASLLPDPLGGGAGAGGSRTDTDDEAGRVG